jgi:assimilatory nitrate reductase catalytic subunit
MNTTCPYCGVGCGVAVDQGAVTGDQSHPANHGKLCVKGSTLAQTLDDSARLMHPVIGGRQASWDEALDLVAEKFASTIAVHGPDSVAIYGSGQFLTEDYYVANKLMKGFIGSANIDTNSRLCMASTVAGHIRAFGEDVVPGTYADIDQADLLVFVGANAAWCHPVLFERAQAARIARGTKIVVIDPRKTATAALADLHLPIRPDADIGLFQQLLSYLASSGAIDATYVAAHTQGFVEALNLAETNNEDLGIDDATLATFFDWFAKTPRVVTLFSQGVNQSVTGTDKVNAIINVHLATGRIGRPGMGPFSLTGQPNAMGGREVGGLANQLAAHLHFNDAADRALLTEFWHAKNLAKKPGLKAVEMFDAVLSGKIKAIWIAATNPAESLPRSERVRAALEACPFVVVADCWPTETTRLANVVLPAAGWSEKDGTVTNSERTISRQRGFRPAPGAAKPDWWMFAELGKRLGYANNFRYANAAEIFREHAALTGYKNNGTRLFDIGRLAHLTDDEYDALAPAQWPQPLNAPPVERFFAHGGFATPSGKAQIVPVKTPRHSRRDASFPFTLNTGRLRDQWHTMTRTGFVPALMASAGEANYAISPIDAERLKIGQGDLLRLTTRHGSAVLPAHIAAGQRPGEIFAAVHWTNAHNNAGNISRLIGPERDPHSGQPGMKHEPAAAEALPTFWHGILQARLCPTPVGQFFSARVPLAEGMHRLTLAGWKTLPPAGQISDWGARLCGADADDERIELSDPGRAIYRLGIIRAGRLIACLFIARDRAKLPQHSALSALFANKDLNRLAILRGGASSDAPASRIVCVCNNVTETTIRGLIKTQSLTTVAAIGNACKAGTNCGSCKGELAEFLSQREPELVS